MKITKMTPIITTDKLAEEKAYYAKFFGFKVIFEYADQHIGMQSSANDDVVISFMAPCEQTPPYQGQGLTVCLEVADVDAQSKRLAAAGLPIVVPVQDNPWGDRSFISVDPAGVSVYVYSPIEPTEEFKKCFKE